MRFSGGDARKLLNMLELVVESEGGDNVIITDEMVKGAPKTEEAVKSFLEGDYLLSLILVVAVGIVEYVLYRTLFKAITESIRNSSICQRKIVDECVSRGITLAEYNVEENIDDETDEKLLSNNS